MNELLCETAAELRALAAKIEATIGPPKVEEDAPRSSGIAPKKSGRGCQRAIEAIDPTTGEVAQRFASQSEAAKAGFTQSAICACLNSRAKQTGGYLWRYAA
jgi:hypothetical protein